MENVLSNLIWFFYVLAACEQCFRQQKSKKKVVLNKFRLEEERYITFGEFFFKALLDFVVGEDFKYADFPYVI